MRVVISGATGAIGIALVRKCIDEGHEILVICHKGSERIKRLPQSPLVTVLELDLDEYRDFTPDSLCPKYDVFYHFAWNGTIGNIRNDTKVQYENIGYALDAVRLAARLGCHTFIGTGSQAEYGRVNGTLSANTPTFPENGYGIAKLCAGQMTRLLCGQLGIRHIWTRILSVYGPYDGEKTMIVSAIKKLLHGETPEFTKGEQQWDYLYSDDAAKAMLLLGENGKDGSIYCIGSGKTRRLSEYITILRNMINPELPLKLGAIPYADKQVMYLCADIEALRRDTGFCPTIEFEDGIKKTIEWVKSTVIDSEGRGQRTVTAQRDRSRENA